MEETFSLRWNEGYIRVAWVGDTVRKSDNVSEER